MRALMVVAFLAVAACAGAPRDPGAPPPRVFGVVDSTELAHNQASTLLEALQRVRPTWFGPRMIRSVFLDGSWIGYPGILRDFTPGSVFLVRHLSESETTAKYGTAHPGPAVELELQFRRRQ